MTDAEIWAAAGIQTGVVSVGVFPGATGADLLAAVGWGMPGIEPPPPVTGTNRFDVVLGDAGTWGTPPGTLGGSW